MNDTTDLSLMAGAFADLAPEVKAASRASQPVDPSLFPAIYQGHPARPVLRSVLSEISPLTREALFLGLAQDGLPVLLNLFDPIPGPLLLAGDPVSGKTAFLQMVARAVDLSHAPTDVEYGVLTDHINDWKYYHDNQNAAGIFSANEAACPEFLKSLVEWAHHNKGEKQSVLLLVDDLNAMLRLGDQAQQDLRWLLLRGPSRRVWPIVTLDAGGARDLSTWLGFFRTRFFSRIQDAGIAEFLSGLPNSRLSALENGSQFALREGSDWLHFWIPSLD